MDKTETAIREEAQRLGIRNWHNKLLVGLKQEVLEAREDTKSEDDKSEIVASTPPPTFEEKSNVYKKEVKNKEKKGNQGFAEAKKGEKYFPFASQDGTKIGLYRRTKFDSFIPPYQKDSSFEFVKWSK